METTKPTFSEALKYWFMLGFISFGGPAGQIALMHTELVEKRKWIDESRFMHGLNYCTFLPGPEAQQLAIYIGWTLHGKRGGLAAGILFILPSVFILLALSIAYVQWGQIGWLNAVFGGLKPAVVAIILMACYKISKKSLKNFFHVAVAIFSFCSLMFFHIPFPLLIITALIIGWFLSSKNNAPTELKLKDLFKTEMNSIARILGMGLLAWVMPLIFIYVFTNDPGFWQSMALFFTKSAVVTFGGAYAVLPYVADRAVNDFHWINNQQMIDGLALGETTPGPLIMVLAFVGFMGGYQKFNLSLAAGTAGLFLTTWYTFLPGFILVLAGAPIIEKTRNDERFKQSLTVVTAVVTGVILHLGVSFGSEVVIRENRLLFFEISLILLGMIFLYFKPGKIIPLICACGIAGVLRYFLMN